jgi:serine/threonine protein kinase
LLKTGYNIKNYLRQNKSAGVRNTSLDKQIFENNTFTLKENFDSLYTKTAKLANNIFSSVEKQTNAKYIAKHLKALNHIETSILRKLPSNERILKFTDAFKDDSNEFILVFTHSIPIIDYITIRNKYSEELVVCILRQLIDAVQWLHVNGIIHLNINPLSIFASDTTSVNVKLFGFENAIAYNSKPKVLSLVTENIEFTGN